MNESISSRELERMERGVGWVYHWLFWSVFLIIPWLIARAWTINYWDSSLERMVKLLPPALLHLPLLLTQRSPSPYVRRHGQQALILAGLRTLSGLYFLGVMDFDGICIFFPVNTLLWLGGSIWGRRQVACGECWWMQRREEGAQLPWKRALPESKKQAAGRLGPVQSYARGERLRTEGNWRGAASYFHDAFLQGEPGLRRQAAVALEQLGEVELF